MVGALARKHPHAGGEDPWAQLSAVWAAETPPRGWGRPLREGGRLFSCGNTPTRVGKTHLAGRCLCVHDETPPRGWGRHSHLELGGVAIRNTPTRVGKTLEFYWIFSGGSTRKPLDADSNRSSLADTARKRILRDAARHVRKSCAPAAPASISSTYGRPCR